MYIDDEALVLGYLVIEASSCGIGVVCLPVHPLDAAPFGCCINCLLGGLGYFRVELGWAFPVIKAVVAIPERLPRLKITLAK